MNWRRYNGWARAVGLVHLIGIALLVIGCAVIPPPVLPTTTPATAPENPGDPLVGTQWQLVTYRVAGTTTPVSAEATVTLFFEAGGEVGGQSGCNSYGGRYDAQAGTIDFSRIVHTMIACEDAGVRQLEQRYLDALPAAGRFEFTPNELTIWYDDGSNMLIFAPLPPTASGD